MRDELTVKEGFLMCLCNFWMAPLAVLFEEFWGILEKPQNHRPHPHLKLWGFLRLIYQKPQILYATLSLKKPRNFSNVYPQPQKTSNFEAETEDPRILKPWLAILNLSNQSQLDRLAKLHSWWILWLLILDFKWSIFSSPFTLCKGPIESNFNFIQSLISMLWHSLVHYVWNLYRIL